MKKGSVAAPDTARHEERSLVILNERRVTPADFGVQPEGTGPLSRRPALPLAFVQQRHGASSCKKIAAVVAVFIV